MLLLTLGFLAIAAGLGYVLWYYEDLPGMVPLHFSTDGTVDRFGEKVQLFLLPGIAALVLVFNTALRRLPAPTRACRRPIVDGGRHRRGDDVPRRRH